MQPAKPSFGGAWLAALGNFLKLEAVAAGIAVGKIGFTRTLVAFFA